MPELRAMLQTLLAERFNLVVHRDTRQLQGFTLVTVRKGQLGPHLRPSSVNCQQSPIPALCMSNHISVGDFKSVGAPISAVIGVISGAVGAPVVDETQLAGTFEIELQWSSELASSSDVPSIFTAIQEQLGLKLESKLVPSDVLVIDHADRPTPD